MDDPTTGPAVRNRVLGLDRAVAQVMLGAPPAMVAADLGCSVATLMRWVKAERRRLRSVLRAQAAPTVDDAGDAPAPTVTIMAHAVVRSGDRAARERLFTMDRPVEPENEAVVEAAYRAAEFDYSGRRVRTAH
jgi:hypothetical protein